MKNKIILTAIWFISFFFSFFIILSYNNGIIIVDGFQEHIEPIIKFYTPYLSGILIFWYFKPFKKPFEKKLENIRLYLALLTTLSLNLFLIYTISKWYLFHSSIILDDIKDGVYIGALLSFLVAPANAYYFGMKTNL